MRSDTCSVAVVGGGPAGLGAATRLRQLGVGEVVVIEREPDLGGVPRHCGHIAFGLREYRRCLSGPVYAARLAADARRAGVRCRRASVVALHAGGRLSLSTPDGAAELRARRVILAAGARETPRSARLVGGQRPLGVVTTGALQSMVYLQRAAPCRRPLIVGTELVSFSALLTCRHAGLRPVAMIESGARVTARRFAAGLPKLLGVPLWLDTELIEILGRDRVEGVRLRDGRGRERVLDCDGVVFSGRFVAEASLLAGGPVAADSASGGPLIDQYGRCSDAAYFAAGNILRPIETAGWSWREGRVVAASVAASLDGRLPAGERWVTLQRVSDAIKYVVPQRIALPYRGDGMGSIQLRFTDAPPRRGRLSVAADGRALWSKRLTALPERRVLIPLRAVADGFGRAASLRLDFTPPADGRDAGAASGSQATTAR